MAIAKCIKVDMTVNCPVCSEDFIFEVKNLRWRLCSEPHYNPVYDHMEQLALVYCPDATCPKCNAQFISLISSVGSNFEPIDIPNLEELLKPPVKTEEVSK